MTNDRPNCIDCERLFDETRPLCKTTRKVTERGGNDFPYQNYADKINEM